MKARLIRYGVTALVGAVIAVIIMWIKGTYVATDVATVYKGLSDGFFVTGTIMAGWGLIVIASNGGTFDIFAYGVNCLVSLFQGAEKRKLRKSFYEYRQSKKEKKRSFFYLLIVGCVYIALAAIFSILFANV